MTIQSCSVLIKLNNITITIGVFYSSASHNITKVILIDYFGKIRNNFIMDSDFNAKYQSWGCRVNNPRGIVLYNLSNEKHIKILSPPEPTYWPISPKKNPDILDIFTTKIPNNLHCFTNNILDLNSDHSSLLLTITATPSVCTETPRLFSFLTDRKQFHDILNE